MENSWAIAAVWLGLRAVRQFRGHSLPGMHRVVEILVGIAAGNLLILLNDRGIISWEPKTNDWIAFLAGFGSILLTFMAGTEVRPNALRRDFKESLITAWPVLPRRLSARCCTHTLSPIGTGRRR